MLTGSLPWSKMAPRKGFGPFTRIINPDIPVDKKWYVLNHRVCAMSPLRYLMKSEVVASFQDEFKQVEIGSLCLADGSKYRGKASYEFEVGASSFGLLAVLLRQHPEKVLFKRTEHLLDYSIS